MPRARSQVMVILEQLDETRGNIERLNETLREVRRTLYNWIMTDHHAYTVDERGSRFRSHSPDHRRC